MATACAGDQGQTPKKLPETDAIFANIADKDGKPLAGEACMEDGPVMRLSIDCKATVKIGEYSRVGKLAATSKPPTTTWAVRKSRFRSDSGGG